MQKLKNTIGTVYAKTALISNTCIDKSKFSPKVIVYSWRKILVQTIPEFVVIPNLAINIFIKCSFC